MSILTLASPYPCLDSRLIPAALEFLHQFCLALGESCFRLSFESVLRAVCACCDASEATQVFLAAAIGATVRRMQLTGDHSLTEALRWRYGHPRARICYQTHCLLQAYIRPRDAYDLLQCALHYWPGMQAPLLSKYSCAG